MEGALRAAMGWGLIAVGGAGLQPQPLTRALAIAAPKQKLPWGLTGLWIGGLVSLSFGLDALASTARESPYGPLSVIQQTVATLPASELPLAFGAFALGPAVSEELLFRGLLIGILARSPLKPAGAIAVSALVFGLAHFDPVQASAAAVLGLYLGTLTWATGSVRPAILAHAVNNGVALLAIRREALDPGWPHAGLGFLWLIGALSLGGALWTLSNQIRQAPATSVPPRA